MLVLEDVNEKLLVLGELGSQVGPAFSVEYDKGLEGFLEGLKIKVSGFDIKSVLLSLDFLSHLVQLALLFGLLSFLALTNTSILDLLIPVEMVACAINVILG